MPKFAEKMLHAQTYFAAALLRKNEATLSPSVSCLFAVLPKISVLFLLKAGLCLMVTEKCEMLALCRNSTMPVLAEVGARGCMTCLTYSLKTGGKLTTML